MKILLGLFLCLVFSLSAFGQSKDFSTLKREAKTFKKSKIYAVGYEKFKDFTLVSFNGATIKSDKGFAFGNGAIITFGVDFVFRGQVLKETNNEFAWNFYAYGQGGWSFLKDRSLYILADGERFELNEGLRDGSVSQGILGTVTTQEKLSFIINRQDLEKFANAKSLEIKLSNSPIKIKTEHQQILKDILQISIIKP